MSATSTSHRESLRTALITACALIAFAANSILCRLALGTDSIDPASFTSARLLSGAVVLWIIARVRKQATDDTARHAGWPAAMLFLYAIAFSYAYVDLSAGTGALILFGAVQATMIVAGIRRGERLRAQQWVGLALAIAGLAGLVWPGISAPSLIGAALMATAGVAWGVYSLLGRGNRDPVATTARNFLYAAPLALAVSVAMASRSHLSVQGLILAVASGTLASGLGYVIWYAALPRLSATRAGIVQLCVPVLAAIAGVVVLSEPLLPRLVLCAAVILGGVALAIAARE